MKKALLFFLITGLILFILAGCSPLAFFNKDKPDAHKTPASSEITPSAVLSAVPLSFREYESSGSARSAAAARNAEPTPVPLGSSVPVVIDTRAVPDFDGKNDNSKAAKLFLTVLKNDVSKLSGFEFGKDKTIGHLEELSPETEAFLLANGMGSSNDFLQLDWGTVKVTLKDDENLIYWSFNDDQTQYVMNIRGRYDGVSYSELEMMFAISGLTYYEKYYTDDEEPAELVAYIMDLGFMKMTSFNRIERNGDAYNSYSVNKNGDSYIPTEIALMDSTGGAVFTSGDGFDSYYFVDTDCAVMEKITYTDESKKFEEYFATRYLELLSGHTLKYCDGSGELPDMLLDDDNISYEQSSSDEVHYYTTISLGQQDALLDADFAGTEAGGKLRFLKHDLVHSLKGKMDAFREASVNPAQYTGLNVDHILGLKAEVVAWSATLN